MTSNESMVEMNIRVDTHDCAVFPATIAKGGSPVYAPGAVNLVKSSLTIS